ncbi:MAG: DUF4340 domain-containing protein [Saccharofermentans sp.]|nr:DUF4340 domain-containing protein [Saccharofermentans sp.]
MKSLKSLLIPFIVMLVLVAVAVGVIISNNINNGDDIVSNESVDVFYIDTTTISTIEVLNNEGSGIGFQSYLSNEGIQCWALLEEYATDAEINMNGVSSWVAVLSSFYSSATVGDSNDLGLSEYGLDNPVYTVIITGFDGVEHRIFIGNKTVNESNCYFMVEGDSNIYTITSAKYLYCGYRLIDFLATQILNIDYSNVATLEFIRAEDNLDMITSCEIYETGAPIFTAISPFQIGCSNYFNDLVDNITNLQITSFVELTEDEVNDYGLANPAYSFILTMVDGTSLEINLSNEVNGYFYGTCSTVDGYFQLSSMQMSGLNTSLVMLLDSYLVYYSAYDMSKITGTYGDVSFTYEIDTEDSISSPNAVAMLNLRNVKIFNSNNRSYAAILYESLITISISGVETDVNPSFDPEVTFTYVTKDYHTYELSFVVRDGTSYYVFLDGEYTSFVVPRTQIFHDGGDNTFDYGAWTAYELAEEAIDNAINGTYDRPVEAA